MKHKFNILRLISFIILLGTSISLNAQTDYHVRPNGTNYGTGNGSNWSNAFSGFMNINWTEIEAGEILYISGGNYQDNLIIKSSGTGNADNLRVIVKRSTTSAHGSDNGWDNRFDSQVVLTGSAHIVIDEVSYITVDGVTKSGIYINHSGINNQAFGAWVKNSEYITLQYLEVDGLNNGDGNLRGIYSMYVNHAIYRYCKLSNLTNDPFILDGFDILIEKCDIGPRIANPLHADVIEVHETNNCVFRNNTVDWSGDDIQFGILGNRTGRWDIYGNIFLNSNGAVKTNSKNPVVGPVYIYNNVFSGCYGAINILSNTTAYVENNIFYNCANIYYNLNNLTHDYN